MNDTRHLEKQHNRLASFTQENHSILLFMPCFYYNIHENSITIVSMLLSTDTISYTSLLYVVIIHCRLRCTLAFRFHAFDSTEKGFHQVIHLHKPLVWCNAWYVIESHKYQLRVEYFVNSRSVPVATHKCSTFVTGQNSANIIFRFLACLCRKMDIAKKTFILLNNCPN